MKCFMNFVGFSSDKGNNCQTNEWYIRIRNVRTLARNALINFLSAYHNICFCKYDMVQGMSIWYKSYDLHQKHNQCMNVAIL